MNYRTYIAAAALAAMFAALALAQETCQAGQLTDAEIRLQAEAQRMMDSGEMPFVIYNGERLALMKEQMDRFGLRQGQTINSTIYYHILCSNPWIGERLPQCQ